MADPSVLFVGTESEIGHHAAPLRSRRPYRILSSADVLKQALPGDLAIFTSEHFDRFRDACQELKQRNVATLYLIDGILEWRNAWENRDDEPACPWTMRPVLAHKVACIGESQARILKIWGNSSKIEIVGIPRLDGLGAKKRQSPNSERARERAFRVLVMTAKWPGFTTAQIENAARSLSDVRDWFEANPTTDDGRQIEVVWRLTQGMHDRIGVHNQLGDLSGTELADVLGRVDAVISTPSTATLEAMLHGIPVAILEYNNTPQYVGAAWQITSGEHIAGVVAELTDPAAEKMLFQQSVLEDALECDGMATHRLEVLIDGMLKIATENVSAGQPLQFPGPILSNSNDDQTGVPVRIHHDLVFAQFREFQDASKLEVQSQLAHSRREIEHLHRELNQLKSELDEAHGIFDQINRHPIAGPIVKVRKKLIDWLDRFKARKAVPQSRALLPNELDSTSSEPLKQN